jgi:hypothetical protein
MLVFHFKLGKNLLRNSRSNQILCPTIIVFSQKKGEISSRISSQSGAVSNFSTVKPVINQTILFNSVIGFLGCNND